MKCEELSPDVRVCIKEGHASGYGGRTGRIIAIEVTVDIGEPWLIKVNPGDMESIPEDPLPPGWEEFEI